MDGGGEGDWNKCRNSNVCDVFYESSTDVAERRRKVGSWGKVASAIRSLIKARGLQLECVRRMHDSLTVPVLLYGNETLI